MENYTETDDKVVNIKNSLYQAFSNSILNKNKQEIINFPEHFILHRPSENVTGDFYWAQLINSTLICCVADFKGFGKTGIELIKLGHDSLNQISEYYVNNPENINPSEILHKLIMKMKSFLEIKNNENDKNSFGINLITIDIASSISNNDNSTFHVQSAGMNNSLYIVSSGKINNINASVKLYERSTPNSNLYDINANDLNFDNFANNNYSFDNHEFKLAKGDFIYLFSDGLIDQIGGPFGKKFMNTQFKNIILDMTDNEIEDQKYVLDYAFELWKDDYPQTDDICILGLKL